MITIAGAYEVTGLKPIRGTWVSDDLTCACPITAMMKMCKPDMDLGTWHGTPPSEKRAEASRFLKINDSELSDFTNAWDLTTPAYTPLEKIALEAREEMTT